MKKIFENAIWWSGVIMVGVVLGISLQFVRAWTEPAEAPPGGNVGAPINTGIIGQLKEGWLQVGGLTVFNDPSVSGEDVTGKVLTAQNAYGQAAWGGGGGVCYTSFAGYYRGYDDDGIYEPDPACRGDDCCMTGFKSKGSLGTWGYCSWGGVPNTLYGGGNDNSFYPPGAKGHCEAMEEQGWYSVDRGEAFLCCQ